MLKFCIIVVVWLLLVAQPPVENTEPQFDSIRECVCTENFMTSLGEFKANSFYTFDVYKDKYCVFLEKDDIHSGSIFRDELFENYFDVSD